MPRINGIAHVAFDLRNSLRSCDMHISWLNHTPHAIAVYASWPALPSAHATLATGRLARALPGPVFHRLDCTSFGWRLQKSRLTPPRSLEFLFALAIPAP